MKFGQPIAIVGLGGIFPGSPTLEAFWENLRTARDTAREVPEGRWSLHPEEVLDPRGPMPDKVYTTRACFIEGFALDAAGLDLPPDLLGSLDPMFHLLLHAGRQAWRDARTEAVDRQRVGVIIGNIALPTESVSAFAEEVLLPVFEAKLFGEGLVAGTEREPGSAGFQTCCVADFQVGGAANSSGATKVPAAAGLEACGTGAGPAFGLNRYVAGLPAGVLARALGLGGGAFTLDAACASSLYAVKLACDELLAGRADAMLTGGLSRPDSLYTQMGFSQLRALSPTGRCSPFDAQGNGLVVGEGSGMLVLKRLADAEAEGDHIYGVIRGIGLSNDIEGNLLAPSSEGQLRAMRAAYAEAGWAPESVDLIECHATGTPVGDAVEFESLRRLWSGSKWRVGQCALGAVKANVGHLLTGAGAAGLIKVLLAMRHETLPPVPNFTRAAEKIPLAESPFQILSAAQPWRRRAPEVPRRAAVSAFGFGGINAHVLVEEYLPAAVKARGVSAGPVVKPVAAGKAEPVPVAIVGMEAIVGPWGDLREFQERVLGGGAAVEPTRERAAFGVGVKERSPQPDRPSSPRPSPPLGGGEGDGARRGIWASGEAMGAMGAVSSATVPGFYLEDVAVAIDRFRIPPKELEEMLPQQLLMLQAAAGALADAELETMDRLRTGVFVGIALDLATTNFHFRWSMLKHAREWARRAGLELSAEEMERWVAQLRDAAGPALNANRTMGALGGIVASRLAREFRLGGPCHTISSEDTSGLHALAVAVRALQQGELDTALVGAVELAGDPRALAGAATHRQFAAELGAAGVIPGEGAVALVLKRLDDAQRDGNRIYGVLRGVGMATGGGVVGGAPTAAACAESWGRALGEAGVTLADVRLVEANASGDAAEDAVDSAALTPLLRSERAEAGAMAGPPAQVLGRTKNVVGHTGAAAGLVSVVKAALSLYQEILAPAASAARGAAMENTFPAELIQQPETPRYWLRDRVKGPRRAVVGGFGFDGNSVHVVMEACEGQDSERVRQERWQPLGAREEALFVAAAGEVSELGGVLRRLADFARAANGAAIEATARRWWAQEKSRVGGGAMRRVALVARDSVELVRLAEAAARSFEELPEESPSANPRVGRGDAERIFYAASPLAAQGEVAFVFPGSGNHFLDMGRELGVQWPEILRAQDRENERLATQLVGDWFWGGASLEAVQADHHVMIFGQVATGTVFSDWARAMGVEPRAVIGYSLGESAGLFSLRAWGGQAGEIFANPRSRSGPQNDLGGGAPSIARHDASAAPAGRAMLGAPVHRESTSVWAARDEMLRRMEGATLFTRDLAGECRAAKVAWKLAEGEEVAWRLGVVDRPAEVVRAALAGRRRVYLLIVNTPGECVIGGDLAEVGRVVADLGCQWFPIAGVTTVHCEVAQPVAAQYRELHLFATQAPADVRFYSGAWGRSFAVTRETAADAILAQALGGVDFPKTVNAAYADGARLFVEMGPGNSCSRMIGKILEGRAHLARSVCVPRMEVVGHVLRVLAQLVAEGVPVNLEALYGAPTCVVGHREAGGERAARRVIVPLALREFEVPAWPGAAGGKDEASGDGRKELAAGRRQNSQAGTPAVPAAGAMTAGGRPASPRPSPPSEGGEGDGALLVSEPFASATVAGATGGGTEAEADPLFALWAAAERAGGEAHEAFLRFSEGMQATVAQQVGAEQALLAGLAARGELAGVSPLVWPLERERGADELPQVVVSAPGPQPQSAAVAAPRPAVALTREQCMEFAVGSIGRVLGERFAAVDAFPTRVRLPDEPLMLVDRILTIEGEPCSMTHGRVVTEHDILPGGWYLDANRIPTCIAVEAGQADLFLSGYLGIDFQSRGLAVYRLLDAVVTFHRGLPGPGEVIHYDIRINGFFRQGDTWLFRFSFEGTVQGEPLLTMRDGCAGFFTLAELQSGKGVIHTALDLRPLPGKRGADWEALVPVAVEAYGDTQIAALRHGDLARCFGAAFAGLPVRRPYTIPGGRMKLLDRVLELDPAAGRFGLGRIRAEADIHPDDWFLTCHFVDDQVMPGTLMFECCMHTFRVMLLRLGWVGEEGATSCEPVPGIASQLKCRGQVIATTRKVVYEITLKEIGYRPEAYAVADALMYADGKPIVEITNMSARLNGLTREGLRAMWAGRGASAVAGAVAGVVGVVAVPPLLALTVPKTTPSGVAIVAPPAISPQTKRPAIFGFERILAYAIGRPSEAFGAAYKMFDGPRKIARLPGPPYQFLDRIVEIHGEPWKLVAGPEIEAEYDVPAGEWYFGANRQGDMPFAVLLEIALQPCGWLAAYLGSALTSEIDLRFRNLGGSAVQLAPVFPGVGTLTTRVKITKVSSSGGMIIQNFDYEMRSGSGPVYRGNTYFGFFSAAALGQQVGVRDAKLHAPTGAELGRARASDFPQAWPFASEQLRMVDRVECHVPDGGPAGLGFVRGTKRVNAAEWFFQAHFFEDPVMPGSLGLEAFLQLGKFLAAARWGAPPDTRLEAVAVGQPHEWVYRGQVIPTNQVMTVEAVVTAADDQRKLLRVDGFLLVDGRVIYAMKNFTVCQTRGG